MSSNILIDQINANRAAQANGAASPSIENQSGNPLIDRINYNRANPKEDAKIAASSNYNKGRRESEEEVSSRAYQAAQEQGYDIDTWYSKAEAESNAASERYNQLKAQLDELKSDAQKDENSQRFAKTNFLAKLLGFGKSADEESAQVSNLDKAVKQAQAEADKKSEEFRYAKQYKDYRDTTRAVEDAYERGLSYSDINKSYSQSLDELNKARATAMEDLNRIRNGADYYGAASTYEEDKARQKADEDDALARLEKLDRQIERVGGMREYAMSRMANERGAEAVIRQGEELALTAREQGVEISNANRKVKNVADYLPNGAAGYTNFRNWVGLLSYLPEGGGKIASVAKAIGEAVRDLPEAYNPVSLIAELGIRAGEDAQHQPQDNWTQEQKDLYNYFYGSKDYGPEIAGKYAQRLNLAINSGEVNNQTEASYRSGLATGDSAGSKALKTIGGLVGAVPDMALAAGDFQNKALDIIATGDYAGHRDATAHEQFSAFNRGRVEDLNRNTLSESIPVIGGKGWGDLYQLGQSSLQSLAMGNVLGEAATLGAFFVNAANSSFDEAMQRSGGNTEYASTVGLLSGAAEVLSEMLPLDHLLKGGKVGSLSFILKQAGIEGAGEAASSLMNQYFDHVAAKLTGEQTAIQQQISNLVRQGMSYEDAEKKVWKDAASDVAFDFVGGAVSGGISGGVQSVRNSLYDYAANRKNRNQQNQQTAQPAQPAQQTQTNAAQGPTTRNPLYEALNPQTPAAETATVAENATTEEPAPATQPTAETPQSPTVETTTPTAQETATEPEPAATAEPENRFQATPEAIARAQNLPDDVRESLLAEFAAAQQDLQNNPELANDADFLQRLNDIFTRASKAINDANAATASTEPQANAEPQPSAAPATEPAAPTNPQPQETTATDESGYTGPLVETQDRVFETQLTDAEKQIPGLTAEEAKHVQHHDAEVDARAKARIQNGVTQARKDLLSAESWSDEDTATAGYIIQAELAAAERATSPEKKAEIYKRIAELKKQWNKQGTEQGRALRQRQRFVAEDIVSTAADILYGEKKNDRTQKALRKLNPQAKDEIMSKVRDFAERFNDMQKGKGTVGDLIQLIKDVSVQRRTTGLFSSENGRPVDFALSEVAKQDGGIDFLKELATAQIKSIASDYIKPGIIDQLKSWRFMAMLSNLATTNANAGSNFIFGSFMEALSGNLALPFDMLMSKVTGQREVAGELGAFSKTKWQGSYDAMLRSFLEVTLDAETAQADYGYKELKGGTFKMVGNTLERLLATIQKYQGYALKTPDQAAKGGTEAQVREGLGKLAERGKAKAENIDALAQREAKYRTLQTEGKVSTAVNKIRSAVDEAVHVGNEKTGKYGLGSDIMPFAQVPANAVAVTLESNPVIGATKALVETAKVLRDGKNVEPGQQAKAARAWGRVANGVAVAATFAALAAKGYLRDEDDDNKDIATQRKAEGRSGVQLNISALLRGDPSEREDDFWINFSWIPPLNGLANFGIDLYKAYTDDGHISFKDVTLASGDALASAFMDFPAVSKISSMIKTYQWSDAEGVVGKGLETLATGAAQTASSMLVPNAVRAAAAGIDPYERDVYNTDTYGRGILYNLVSGVPGLRQMLPERLDTFGQPMKNEGGLLHFLDKTVIPGDVNQHNRQSAASKYVEELIAKTGDKKLQPSRNAPYNVTLGDGDDKQKVELTPAERREYQQTRGQAISEMTEALAGSQAANGATDEQKALFNAIKNAAEHQAEAELAEGKGIEHTASQIQGKDFMSFAVMGAPDAVLDRLAANGMTGKGRNLLWDTLHSNGESPQNIVSAIDQIDPDGNGRASQADLYAYLRDKSNLTVEQKQSIWETYNPTGKTSYANYAAKNGGDSSKASQPTGNALYDYTR